MLLRTAPTSAGGFDGRIPSRTSLGVRPHRLAPDGRPDVTASDPSQNVGRLVEQLMRSGSWWWEIDGDKHFWSPGCLDLLGLAVGDAPSYSRLIRAVHPVDRPRMPRLADLLRGEPIAPQVVQVIRADGTTRIVSAAFETQISPDGRPRRACGVLVDVTEREWLARSRASAVSRRRRLDAHAGVLRFTMRQDRSFDFVAEAAESLGHPLPDINADPFAVICPGDAAAVHALISRHQEDGTSLTRELAIDLPRARTGHALLVMVPVLGEHGEPDTWDGLLQIRDPHDTDGAGAVADAVGRVFRGSDFVAARALLGWSRQEMAEASHLSISTIRRLEDDEDTGSGRSRGKAVEALRRAGVRFQPTLDGSVAMSRRPADPGRAEAP